MINSSSISIPASGALLADRVQRGLFLLLRRSTAARADAGAGAIRDDDLRLHLHPEGVRTRQRLHPQPHRPGVAVSTVDISILEEYKLPEKMML